MKIKLKEIKVSERRQRIEIDARELERLAASLRTTGLIQPIVVDDSDRLICGERRVKAAQMNGWEEIECKRISDLDQLDMEIMEFEENVRRVDLSPVEEVRAHARLHDLYQEKFGRFERKDIHRGVIESKGWRQKETAELLGVSEAHVSQTLDIAKSLDSDPILAKAKTRESMIRRVRRKRDEGLRKIMAEIAVTKEAEKDDTIDEDSPFVSTVVGDAHLVLADSRAYVKELEDESVDLVLTDPLWDVWFDGEISDKNDVYDLTQKVMRECYRVMKDGSHGFMFFAMSKYEEYKVMLGEIGFGIDTTLLIWYKEARGWARDPYLMIRPDYEPCFHFFKIPRPKFVKPLWAVHKCDLESKSHKAQKPVEMLSALIDATTVEGELVLDPFMGSGTTLEAAQRMGRRSIGIDVSKEYWDYGVTRLKEVMGSAREEVKETT